MARPLILRDTNPDFFVGPLLLPLTGTLDEPDPSVPSSTLLLRSSYFDMRNRIGSMLENLRIQMDDGIQLPHEASSSTGNVLNSSPLLPQFVEQTSGIKRNDASTPYIYSRRNAIKDCIAVCDELARLAVGLDDMETAAAVNLSNPGNFPWTNIFTTVTVFGKSWKTEAAGFLYNAFMLALHDSFFELHSHRLGESIILERLTPRRLAEITLAPVIAVTRQFLNNILQDWERLDFSWLVAQGFIPTREYFYATYGNLLSLMQLDYEVLHVLLPLFPDASTFETTLNLLSYDKEIKRPAVSSTLPEIHLDTRSEDGSPVNFDELVKRGEATVSQLRLDIPSKKEEEEEAKEKKSTEDASVHNMNLFANLTMCYSKIVTAKELALKLINTCFVRVNYFEDDSDALPLDDKNFYDTLRCCEPQTFFLSKYINQASVAFQLIQLALERIMVSDPASFKPLKGSLDRFFDSPQVILCLSGTRESETVRHIRLYRANALHSTLMQPSRTKSVAPSSLGSCAVFPSLITACDLAFDVWTMQVLAQMPPTLLSGIEKLKETTMKKGCVLLCNKDWQKRPEAYQSIPLSIYKPSTTFVDRMTIHTPFDEKLKELIKVGRK